MKQYRGIAIAFIILVIASYLLFGVAQSDNFAQLTGSGELSVVLYLLCLVVFAISLITVIWKYHQLRAPSQRARELIEGSLISYSPTTKEATTTIIVEYHYIEELLIVQLPVAMPYPANSFDTKINDVVKLVDPSQKHSIYATVAQKNETTIVFALTKRPIAG